MSKDGQPWEKLRGARARLRAYFQANAGKVVHAYELREIAGGQEQWSRRLRELRQEEGMNIQSHNDNATLTPGQYLYDDSKPLPAFKAGLSREIRALVLDRNGFTCQMCGIAAGEPHPDDGGRKARLHIGHIRDLSHGGSNEPENLRALCSVCNEGAANVMLPRPEAAKLLAQLRRSSRTDQQEVLAWLLKKFPDQDPD